MSHLLIRPEVFRDRNENFGFEFLSQRMHVDANIPFLVLVCCAPRLLEECMGRNHLVRVPRKGREQPEFRGR